MSISGTLGAQPTSAPGPSQAVPVPINDSGTGAFVPGINGIRGDTRNLDGRALRRVPVLLRNLRNGHTVQRLTTDDAGAFVFRNVAPSTYVVEVVTGDNNLVAVSPAVTVNTGELVRTTVNVLDRRRSFDWWSGTATSTAIDSAASNGVLAIEPGEAVSPPGGKSQ